MARPAAVLSRNAPAHAEKPAPRDVAVERLRQLDRLSRQLGLRWQRQFVLLRRPVRVVLHLSRHPSLSLRAGPVALNISARGLRVTTRVARGLSYRTCTYPWPWLRPVAENGGAR